MHGADSLAKVVERMAPFGSKCTAVKEVPEKGRFKFKNKAFDGFTEGYYPDGFVRMGHYVDGRAKYIKTQNVTQFRDQKFFEGPRERRFSAPAPDPPRQRDAQLSEVSETRVSRSRRSAKQGVFLSGCSASVASSSERFCQAT